MDVNRSTTPPLPPPESSETLQTAQPAHAHAQLEPPSPSGQREAEEATGGDMESETHQLREPIMDPGHQNSKLPRPANSKTPEPPRAIHISSHQMYAAGLAHGAHLAPERSSTPDTPGAGSLSPFDWDDLEARFEKALASANQHEDELMGDFESLVKYFKIWASTAAAHDNERASKRLQTRTHFVKLREEDLSSKKQNYEQVVSAFQNAMILLHRAHT